MQRNRDAIIALLAGKGFTPIAPKILWPAEHLVDVFGEELKKRLFLTSTHDGVEYALRPDFTVPVALSFMETGKATAQYSYCGTVFRQRDDGQSGEFIQTGVEDFGAADFAAKDAEILALAIELCESQGAKRSEMKIHIGDADLFTAVLNVVQCPPLIAAKLKQDLGRIDRLVEDLRENNRPVFIDQGLIKLLDAIESETEDKAIEILTSFFAGWEYGLNIKEVMPIGNRTPSEIVARLHTRKQGRETRLTQKQVPTIQTYVQIECPLNEALGQLKAFTKKYQLDLQASLLLFQARIAAFEAAGIDTSKITFSGSFGRRLNYYSGFMFNITLPHNAPDKPLAGGGRYDGLLTMLGHDAPTPAVGFAVWNERFLP